MTLAGPQTRIALRTGGDHWSGLVVLAVGYQWFYNGANYLAFKLGVEALPAFLLAVMRFSIAGLLLLRRCCMDPRMALQVGLT